MIERFSSWLEATALHATLQEVSWAIPALQIIHILAIAAAFSSICLLSARIAGFNQQLNAQECLHSNIRLFWPSALILVASGALLVVSEPGRDLLNPAFRFKMLILVGGFAAVAAVTRILNGAGLQDDNFALNKGARKSIAIALVAIFTAIIICGRWIAYFDAGNN